MLKDPAGPAEGRRRKSAQAQKLLQNLGAFDLQRRESVRHMASIFIRSELQVAYPSFLFATALGCRILSNGDNHI